MSRRFNISALALGAGLAAAVAGAALPASRSLANTPAPARGHAADGADLYQRKCAICHDKDGGGTFMLNRRPGMTTPVLIERTDLRAPFVKTVVRNGMVNMPAFTKVELPDADLEAIAHFLQSSEKPRK